MKTKITAGVVTELPQELETVEAPETVVISQQLRARILHDVEHFGFFQFGEDEDVLTDLPEDLVDRGLALDPVSRKIMRV